MDHGGEVVGKRKCNKSEGKVEKVQSRIEIDNGSQTGADCTMSRVSYCGLGSPSTILYNYASRGNWNEKKDSTCTVKREQTTG